MYTPPYSPRPTCGNRKYIVAESYLCIMWVVVEEHYKVIVQQPVYKANIASKLNIPIIDGFEFLKIVKDV